MNVYLFSKITKKLSTYFRKRHIPNFAIAKLQSYQHLDNLDVSKITFGNFASVKIVDVVNNQNITLNFANFATI